MSGDSPPGGPAAAPSGRLAIGVAVVLAILALGWIVGVVLAPASPNAAPSASAAASATAAPSARAPATRPVLAVLGVAPRGAGDLATTAAIVTDAVRVLLDDTPGVLFTLPASSIAGLRAPAGGSLSSAEPRSFAKRPGAAGHIDRVVRGEVELRGAILHGTLALVDTATGAVQRTFAADGPAKDPVGLARALATPLRAALGLSGAGPVDALDVAPDAYGAFLAARDARFAGDLAGAQRSLATALRVAPDFTLARVEELSVLYAAGRLDDVTMRAEPLLSATPEPPPRERALAEATLSLGRGLSRDAVKKLEALLDRFGHDGDAESHLVALRMDDPATQDLAEAERVARRLLAFSPAHAEVATRLVQTLALRGRVDAAAQALTELGWPEDDSASPQQPWAGVWLYRGPAERAIRHFDAVLAARPEDPSAENLSIAARLVGGGCAAALGRAEARLDASERGPERDLVDPTYALAVQAHFCLDDGPGALAAAARWAARRPQGKDASVALGLRARLLAGEDPRALGEEAERDLTRLTRERGGRALDRTELLLFFARTGTSTRALRAEASWAESAAGDKALPNRTRGAYRRLARLLAARALLEEGAVDEALAAYDGGAGTFADVVSEADLPLYVGARFAKAEALTRLGREEEARTLAKELAALGYPRVLAMDVSVLAGRILR